MLQNEQSLPTQDAFLGHCFIGSLDTEMCRREGSGESSNQSGGQPIDWGLVSWVVTARKIQVSHFGFESDHSIKKRGFVLTEKLVDKVAASLISNLLQGRKTLPSKISTAVKFIRNQDNFSWYLQQIKVIILLIHKVSFISETTIHSRFWNGVMTRLINSQIYSFAGQILYFCLKPYGMHFSFISYQWSGPLIACTIKQWELWEIKILYNFL